MYVSRPRRAGMLSRVVRSCILELGTALVARASDMTVEMAIKELIDSLPPANRVTDEMKRAVEKKLYWQ
jgi:hypothetical protein